jgi:hypothetical protein|tara:strand:- start:421 stop:609 length:189 start_codon:yes stop_codon:yes gene_type:complete
MSIHCIISEADQLRIVNALAFYHHVHSTPYRDADELEQFAMAYKEDGAEAVDRLADRIANLK